MADPESGDETPKTPAGPKPRKPAWLTRPAALAALACLAVGFGGGIFAAHGLRSAPPPAGAKPESFAWPFFGHPRAANARRPEPARPDGFAVWTSRIDTTGPEAKACIRMSRPLDPSKAYGDYVLLSPQTGSAPAVSVNNDELCIGGLGFTDRRVTLLKGLPGRGADQLAANADIDFTFGERPPYVGFAGDGVILPREESDGVGIETVSVQKLELEVWRVPDRNLVRVSIEKTDPVSEGEYGGWNPASEEGQKVWSGALPVRGETGERTVTVFPLGAVLKEMRPGAYVIVARDASGGRDARKTGDDDEYDGSNSEVASASRWVVFTDMALSTYTGADGLDGVVRSLKTAKTLAGVRVALVARNGETLAEAQTDAAGRVQFAKPLLGGRDGQHAKMMMAYGAQGDLAVLDLDRSPIDLSQQGVGGRNDPNAQGLTEGRTATAVDAYLYGDRGIYRPGETIHLVALVRDREAAAVSRKGSLVIQRPSGTEFRRIAFDKTTDGYLAQDVVLPAAAPRGRWTAKLMVDGIDQPAGQMGFAVEDFAPQRLAVDADAHSDVPVRAGEARAIDINARFLYGAPGAGLQTQGEARISADPNPFPQFKGYVFGDQQTAFQEKVTEAQSTVTDGSGHAVMTLPADAGAGSALPLKAVFTASVFEPGGRPVRESVFLKLRAQPLYLGVKLDQADASGRDAPVTYEVIAVDAAGNRVAAPSVTWTLIAENWNYDWFQQNGRWQWRRTARDSAIATGTGEISAAGALRYSRRLAWGDYRLEVTTPTGAKTVIKFAAGWGETAGESDAPDLARVSAGTDSHNQGDYVDITIKAPYAGEAQIAVATDHLIDFRSVHVGEGGTTVRLKSNPEWGGGAYVLVSVIQPRDPGSVPTPRRALGVAYVPLEIKGRKLGVEIGAPVKLDSKAPVEAPVKVSGLGLGERAYVTVAAVDEGILRLTKFDTPDPVKWYFGKRALNLDYRDDYGRLLDANLGAPGAVNFGADSLGGEGLTVTPTKTVALWSGVVRTGLDGRATVRLPAAAFNGEVRLMAVAWTDKAVGSAARPMTVREAVVADLNLPRFLAPRDRAQGTLELHNLEGKPGGYDVTVTGSGGIGAAFHQLVQLVLGQRTTQRIDIAAPDAQGVGKVAFAVNGPGFATRKEYGLQTRLGWGPETRAFTALQKPGETFSPDPQSMAGFAQGSVTMTVSYSPFKGFDPAAVALSLSRYPYGCTEQLVSTAYPLLYAAELTTDPRLKAGRSAALSVAVAQILDRQSLDGAFGLWRAGDGEAEGWLGAYATDFLLEAKAAGAPVPQETIDRAMVAMRALSQPQGFGGSGYRTEYPTFWTPNEAATKAATARLKSRTSAYALYVLAKAGRGDLARLRWWHDIQMKQEGSPVARAQVAAGLAMMGDQARARSALQAAVQALGYRDDFDWYQSPARDLAGVITYGFEAGQPDIARGLEARLDGVVAAPDRLNTQEQARLIQAAHAMLKAAGPMKITAVGVYDMPPVAGSPRWAVGKLAQARFTNGGTGALWRTVTVQGVSVSAPAPRADGIGLSKSLWTLTGGRADPGSVRQGDRIIIQLSGASRQGRSMLMVVDDALPAGYEVEAVLSPDDAKTGPYRFLGELTGASVQEKRDDRYIAAFTIGGNKPFNLAYVARAVTPGDFLLPGAEASDMYHPAIAARTAASRTVIAGQ